MKADSSRAIAVATTVGRLPFRVSDRKRPHNLICAFQAISRTAVGAAATFICFSRLTQLYQLACSNSDFWGVPAGKRESNQRRLIANRL